MEAPESARELDRRLQRGVSTHHQYEDLRVTVADVVATQMLPEGSLAKGGAALRMRLGQASIRFTTDLDVARATGLDGFLEAFRSNLSEGWGGFTGTARLVKRHHFPKGVPGTYLSDDVEATLYYRRRRWTEVQVEVGHNEVGDADEADYVLAPDILDLFERIGLPKPGRVPLMRLDYQVAQKLHAASAEGSARAHDLVDLQVIAGISMPELSGVAVVCRRVFAYRRGQVWPPTVSGDERWADLYEEAARGMDVIPDVDGALAWTNDLVRKIDSADA